MTGAELQTIRKHHGWTQRELGKLLGVSELAVRRYELGLRKVSKPLTHLLRILTDPGSKKWVHIFFADGA